MKTAEPVFISYSQQDAGPVNQLVKCLERAGHEVWLDRSDIPGGSLWQEEITKGIEAAHFFVLVLSPSSVRSEYVARELDLAELKKKRVFPVTLVPVDVPTRMEYALVGLQRIDFSDSVEVGAKRLQEAFAASATARDLPIVPENETGDPTLRNQRGKAAEQQKSALAGALCWGVGGVAGATLAAGLVGCMGACWSGGALVLVVGALFGSLHGRWFSKTVMRLEIVIAVFLLGVGVCVAIYGLIFTALLGAGYAGHAFGLGTGGGLAGGLAWLFFKLTSARAFIRNLKTHGRVLTTDYKGVRINGAIKFNDRSPMQIVSQWRDPQTHEIQVFYSKNLWFDPSEFVEMKSITVYTDPDNVDNYWMDVSFLPKVRG